MLLEGVEVYYQGEGVASLWRRLEHFETFLGSIHLDILWCPMKTKIASSVWVWRFETRTYFYCVHPPQTIATSYRIPV